MINPDRGTYREYPNIQRLRENTQAELPDARTNGLNRLIDAMQFMSDQVQMEKYGFHFSQFEIDAERCEEGEAALKPLKVLVTLKLGNIVYQDIELHIPAVHNLTWGPIRGKTMEALVLVIGRQLYKNFPNRPEFNKFVFQPNRSLYDAGKGSNQIPYRTIYRSRVDSRSRHNIPGVKQHI